MIRCQLREGNLAMGIKNTIPITRTEAILRIKGMIKLMEEKDYEKISRQTFEPDFSMSDLINSMTSIEILDLDHWTSEMLAGCMDRPGFRYSMFEDYRVINDEE